jgi:hypothetical protein
MKAWRDRGFVHDSEDEDEGSIETQSPSRQDDLRLRDEHPHSEQQRSELEDTRDELSSIYVGRQHVPQKQGQTLRTERVEVNEEDANAEADHSADELALNGYPGTNDGTIVLSRDNNRRRLRAAEDNDGFMPISSPLAQVEELAQVTHDTPQQTLLASSPPLLESDHLVIDIDAPTQPAQDEFTTAVDDLHQKWSAPQRNFRQRKAVQLNPYRILDGQYQKEMRARGIVPTRVVQPSYAGQRRDQNDKSEGSQSGSESDRDSTFESPPPLPPNRDRARKSRESSAVFVERPVHPQRYISTSPASSASLQGDDLPALDDLLKHRNRKEKVFVGSKRRKLLDTTQRPNRLPRMPEIIPFKPGIGVDVEVLAVEIPPSPSSSIGASQELPRAVGRGGFRIPPGLSPQKPPTPATSSSTNANRRKRLSIINANSSPAPRLPRARFPNPDTVVVPDDEEETESPPDSSLSSSEDDRDSGQLKVIQRRIKGVLPASWLKLDVKAQGKAPNQKAVSRLQYEMPRDTQQAGVARRRLKPSTSGRSITEILAISSEDSEADGSQPVVEQQALPAELNWQPSMSFLSADDDPGELMEDNAVDFMLPSVPHEKRSKASTVRKTQVRLTDAFVKTSNSTLPRKESKGTSKAPARVRTHFRPPKLSILDVVSSSPERSIKVPSFLKVALRQAKRLPNQARQRPLQKSIRLQTRKDTVDVNSVLEDWRTGRIKPKDTSTRLPSTNRKPFAPRDANIQSILPFNTDNLQRNIKRLHTNVPDRNTHSGRETSTTDYRNRNVAKLHRAPKRLKLPHARLQDGQLEAEENAVMLMQDRLRFTRNVRQANHDYATARKTTVQPLARSLSELETQIEQQASPQARSRGRGYALAGPSPPPPLVRPRNLRKRRPQRVDVETVEYRQPEEFTLPHSPSVQLIEQNSEALQDLNPWNIPYTTDFDILPLPTGIFFHDTTFLGSGNFKKAVDIGKRDLNVGCGTHLVSIGSLQCHFGPWNEEFSADVKVIFAHIAASVASAQIPESEGSPAGNHSIHLESAIHAVEKLLMANSKYLSFSDSIDRSVFCLVYVNELEELQSLLEEYTTRNLLRTDQELARMVLRLVLRLTVLAAQVFTVTKNSANYVDLGARSEKILRRQTEWSVFYLAIRGFEEIRVFYNAYQRYTVREAGIKDNQASVEAVVILNHLLQAMSIRGLSFWESVNANLLPSTEYMMQTGSLEHRWLNLFTLLPLLEFDAEGVHQIGCRYHLTTDNWDMVKKLLSSVFALYQASVAQPGSTMNDYVRALLVRCHHLIKRWGWKQCESVIGIIFDFFAKREYMSLHKEEKSGSPRFLEHLADHPSLEVSRDEKAFHIFLKIIAVGLTSMRKVYTDKKTMSIVWRWIPNHNRAFDKDKELRKEDLDALRNQHDLLSTLYWATPAGFRPRIDLICGLVDHSASHLEACRINIKTWSNLAAFQLSTDEPTQHINPFASWSKDILGQNVSLYKFARPDLEAQYEAARQVGVSTISAEKLETMISRNQNGIVAALSEAVAGLRQAITTAQSLVTAWSLLRDSDYQVVFSLFDPKKKKANAVLVEVLSLFDAFLDLIDRQSPAQESQTVSEESQDYGEWPEEDDAVPIKGPVEHALDLLLEQAGSLLSNLFGSETSPEDNLLMRMVEHWARLAATLSHRKLAELETFIGDYGRYSWSQLRDTSQQRKYGPYFFSCLLRQQTSVLQRHREQALSTWICSLVERDAQLKYQHVLTSDLLNACSDDPLLKNLPFTSKSGIGKYDVSASELHERRLALLSSVLSNMQDEYQRTLQDDPAAVRTLRTEYSSLLSKVMLQMRRNYEELQQGEVVAGAYVTFVQSMIEFMQQYTADICPVDKYFTDSTAFPLPANDPTYLVGRLRSYDLKLDDTKVVKQLIMFVQNVSERAAVDNEQSYLITQLSSAMCGTLEHEQITGQSLRFTLVRIIISAYIEGAFDSSAAWILTRPLLSVCGHFFKDMLYKYSATNTLSVQINIIMLTTTLSAMMKAVSPLEYAPHLFQQSHVMSTLSHMFDVATICIPTLDYVRRRNVLGLTATKAIKYLRDFSLYAGSVLLGRADAFPPTNLGDDFQVDTRTRELKAFCAQKLREDLRDKWKTEHGRYFVKRGTMWRDLQVSLGSLNEEKAILIDKIEVFHEALDRVRLL